MHRVGSLLSLFSSRRNWDLPTPHPQMSVPPPFGSGGRGTLAGDRGAGRVPVPTRGHTLWYSIYICTLWGGGCNSPASPIISPPSTGGSHPSDDDNCLFYSTHCIVSLHNTLCHKRFNMFVSYSHTSVFDSSLRNGLKPVPQTTMHF